jgi:hypothetical protein
MNDVKLISKKEKGTNRHWKNFVDKDYLGSHNLEKGEEMLLTISRFEGEEEVTTADGKKVKQVIYFKEPVPKMILNITNGNTLTSLYGSHPDSWIGKQVQLYAASVKAFGKTQDALRIRDFVPKHEVDVASFVVKLKTAKTVAELETVWKTFPTSVRSNQELIEQAKGLKAIMSQDESN